LNWQTGREEHSEEEAREKILKFVENFKEGWLEEPEPPGTSNDAGGHDRPPFLALSHVVFSATRDRFRPSRPSTP
jgi:hypothetical protein